jgi:hypothetical protein
MGDGGEGGEGKGRGRGRREGKGWNPHNLYAAYAHAQSIQWKINWKYKNT